MELARQGLGIYAQELSPAYAQLRDRLMGHMAINNIMLDELRFQEQSVSPNKELISEFAGCLPAASYRDGTSHFTVSDTYTARVIESNTVWAWKTIRVGVDWDPNTRENEPVYADTKIPFYILGERPSPNKPKQKTELLIMSALKRSQNTHWSHFDVDAVEVFTDEKEAAEQIMAESVVTSYSEEEMKMMFNGKSLRLTEAQAKVFRPTNPRRPFFKRNVLNAVRFSKGIHISRASSLKDQLTSDVLAQFGVFDRLNRLAVAFDKVSELDILLEKYQATAPKNPLDKLLDT